VVVVDPRFGEYRDLAASARVGRITLHFRSSGADAIRLSRRLKVDAWLVANDLDDMAGSDLLELLRGGADHSAVAMVREPFGPQGAAADEALEHPITLADLERLLGMPSDELSSVFSSRGSSKPYVTLPVGVGAAFVAIAVLMLG
jgi:hypothetical protein